MQKQIKRISNRHFVQNAPGFKTVDMFHSDFEIEPFLVFTEFHMDRPVFGPHPHAGVSVMTYMMPDSQGSFLNRDSRGDHSIIEPGGIHVTQAGSGVKHDEVPTVLDTDCHGFQIWINHADKDRLVAPAAFHAAANEVPEFKNEHLLVRIIQGEYENLKSPIELVTPTTLLDITVQPNSSVMLAAQEMAFVYVVSGEINIAENAIAQNTMVTFEKEGHTIKVNTGAEAANFIFVSGTPHNEPIVPSGPFVMTTNEQMTATKRRFQHGEMGVLDPL